MKTDQQIQEELDKIIAKLTAAEKEFEEKMNQINLDEIIKDVHHE